MARPRLIRVRISLSFDLAPELLNGVASLIPTSQNIRLIGIKTTAMPMVGVRFHILVCRVRLSIRSDQSACRLWCSWRIDRLNSLRFSLQFCTARHSCFLDCSCYIFHYMKTVSRLGRLWSTLTGGAGIILSTIPGDQLNFGVGLHPDFRGFCPAIG